MREAGRNDIVAVAGGVPMKTFFTFLLLSLTLTLAAAPVSLTLMITPGADIPVGESAEFLEIGGGAALASPGGCR